LTAESGGLIGLGVEEGMNARAQVMDVPTGFSDCCHSRAKQDDRMTKVLASTLMHSWQATGDLTAAIPIVSSRADRRKATERRILHWRADPESG
jgi:hypothetical protein